MRRHKRTRTALVGLLVLSAFSLAAASGKRPVMENAGTSIRMLTEAEVAQVAQRFPGLRLRPGGISQLKNELLERLFPSTSFYKTLNRGGRPPFPYLIAISGDKLLSQPSGFNSLLAEHSMEVTDKNIIELAKAFVVLAVGDEPITNPTTGDPGGLDSFPQITFLQGKRIEEHDRPSATAIDVEISCRIGNGGVQTWKFTQSRRTPRKGEWVKVGQFARALLFIDGKPVREYRPEKAVQETRRGELDTDPRVEIDVTVGNATVEQESIYYHYYLETYRDGAPTNYWVRFRLYDFESHEPYVYVRVEPKWPYTYGPNDTLGPIDIDESGEGYYDWTPSLGIQTGIAEVCAGNMPPGDTFCQRTPLPDNKELTLEKVITDIFPGAGDDTLEVYFCHQFLVNHPQGQGYAPTFANLVKDAAIESWQKQVNDWGLGTPPDADHKHQVFINNGINWYHTIPSTWAECGVPPVGWTLGLVSVA